MLLIFALKKEMWHQQNPKFGYVPFGKNKSYKKTKITLSVLSAVKTENIKSL